MKAIIVGGGKVGYYLVKTLKGNSVNITLIEKDPVVAARISEELDIDVVCGDGSDLEVLNECDIQHVELIAAVTGSDEENLVVCQIAKTSFHVAKTIARINNPKNIAMFKALGVDKTVCSTEVIADLIEYEVDNDSVRVVQTFEMGSMVLVEVLMQPKSQWLDVAIKDIQLPLDCVVVSIVRDGKVIYPRGDTVVLLKDEVLVVTDKESMQTLRKSVCKG
ncbi:MAG: NAD-binding protein [Erysipelotrichaceae bacterium]